MITVAKNYILDWTESFREWLAWKIFPEQAFYMEAVRRMAEIDENERCVKALDDADSACAGWAIETIRIKFTRLADLMGDWEQAWKDEPPF